MEITKEADTTKQEVTFTIKIKAKRPIGYHGFDIFPDSQMMNYLIDQMLKFRALKESNLKGNIND